MIQKAVFFILLMAGVTTATALEGRGVRITPEYPIEHCDFRRASHINGIFGVHVSEDEAQLEIQFTTYYYAHCKQGRAVREEILNRQPLTFWVEGINWPWTPSPFVEELDYDESSNFLHVSLIFDKALGFKERKTRHFDYRFTPSRDLHFDWNIDLQQINAQRTRLLFNGQEF